MHYMNEVLEQGCLQLLLNYFYDFYRDNLYVGLPREPFLAYFLHLFLSKYKVIKTVWNEMFSHQL